MELLTFPKNSLHPGVELTPPVIGRISFGSSTLESNDGDPVVLPVMDDHFTISTLDQAEDLSWPLHPLHKGLQNDGAPLRALPVRLAYNDPGLTLQVRFNCYESSMDNQPPRLLCTGDGNQAQRFDIHEPRTIKCPKPDRCSLALRHECKPRLNAYFQIEGQEDGLGTFVLRSSGRTTINALSSRLLHLWGLTRGAIFGMPLMLTLKRKSNGMIPPAHYYFADLELRPGESLATACAEARERQAALSHANLDLELMEHQLREAFALTFHTDPDPQQSWMDAPVTDTSSLQYGTQLQEVRSIFDRVRGGGTVRVSEVRHQPEPPAPDVPGPQNEVLAQQPTEHTESADELFVAPKPSVGAISLLTQSHSSTISSRIGVEGVPLPELPRACNGPLPALPRSPLPRLPNHFSAHPEAPLMSSIR